MGIHTGARQHGGRASLEGPIRDLAVLAFYLQDQDGVRIDEPEFLDRARELDRVLGIKHGKRMMRSRVDRRDSQSKARQ
jgi:hypothetical protein